MSYQYSIIGIQNCVLVSVYISRISHISIKLEASTYSEEKNPVAIKDTSQRSFSIARTHEGIAEHGYEDHGLKNHLLDRGCMRE